MHLANTIYSLGAIHIKKGRPLTWRHSFYWGEANTCRQLCCEMCHNGGITKYYTITRKASPGRWHLSCLLTWTGRTSPAPRGFNHASFFSVWGHLYVYVRGRTFPSLLGFWTQTNLLKDDQIHLRSKHLGICPPFVQRKTWLTCQRE